VREIGLGLFVDGGAEAVHALLAGLLKNKIIAQKQDSKNGYNKL
jgi:hypothetical protein